ncbi:hypothetical protein BACCIP111895_02472 [Neobacillus rhizosphaerae]|uniref:Uncharacterized protein n=1 Tax=Neobacillus rhizosphaerae TaxID=2880965 RepID=A0ABM9ESX2_9BACI|nr:hypothetical protein [Neobacillus rhizosphaerae]CAH2715288.1 hypothetical protein BACCIP111895_02472 [Neobacillus rhizosphaerae]
MLSFEEKKAIFRSFQLKEKKISNGRVNFVYPESKQRGQVLATQLHPSGNGYVIGKYLLDESIKHNGYKLDSRGYISVRDFSKDELTKVISEVMKSMSEITDDTLLFFEKKTVSENANLSIERQKASEKVTESKIEPIDVAMKIPEKAVEGKSEPTEATMKIPEKAVESKSVPSENIPAVAAYDNLACSLLNHWVGLTISVAECGFIVWRNTVRKLGRLR